MATLLFFPTWIIRTFHFPLSLFLNIEPEPEPEPANTKRIFLNPFSKRFKTREKEIFSISLIYIRFKHNIILNFIVMIGYVVGYAVSGQEYSTFASPQWRMWEASACRRVLVGWHCRLCPVSPGRATGLCSRVNTNICSTYEQQNNTYININVKIKIINIS